MFKMKPYPKNCSGDFFVEDEMCIACNAPHDEAPELITYDENSCYFIKQPETEEELNSAINALASSCCSALIYKGKDTRIIELLKNDEAVENDCILNISLITK